MQVHIETLRVSGQRSYTTGKGKKATTHTFDTYAVEITIGNDRRETRCSPTMIGGEMRDLMLYDLAIRFSSGAKVWPGHATYWPKTGNVNGLHPKIDKRGHFSCVGFFEDFEAAPVRSQHNAVA